MIEQIDTYSVSVPLYNRGSKRSDLSPAQLNFEQQSRVPFHIYIYIYIYNILDEQ
jgi:hypothetical protein